MADMFRKKQISYDSMTAEGKPRPFMRAGKLSITSRTTVNAVMMHRTTLHCGSKKQTPKLHRRVEGRRKVATHTRARS